MRLNQAVCAVLLALHGAMLAPATATAAPATAAKQAELQSASPAAAVSAAAAAIVAAFGRNDLKAYFALFAPDATFVFHTTPRRLNSRAEYEAEWAAWQRDDGLRIRACVSSDPRVQVLGDIAIFTHSVRTELTMKQGDSVLRERETIVFQRRGGRWLAVHEHLSPDPAADAAAGR